MYSSNWKYVLVTCGLCINATVVGALKCAVCGSRQRPGDLSIVQSQFPHLFDAIPDCQEGQALILNCPAEARQGCLTQGTANSVTKLCSGTRVEACAVANNVEYCYCLGEMCNLAMNFPRTRVSPEGAASTTGDDESELDEGEGSGSKTTAKGVATEVTVGTVNNVERKNKTGVDDFVQQTYNNVAAAASRITRATILCSTMTTLWFFVSRVAYQL